MRGFNRKRALTGALLSAGAASLALVAWGQEADENVPVKATVGGNYSGLLRKIEVPQDKATYGEFFEGGHFPGMSYAGHADLPEGHWVYVAPHWYIWKSAKNPRSNIAARAELLARLDPFNALTGKEVQVRIDGHETIAGRLVENRYAHVLVRGDLGKNYWISKLHISYMSWDDEEGPGDGGKKGR